MSPIKRAFKNGHNLLTKREDSILSAAAFMFVIMIMTKLLGLAVKAFLAYRFGEYDLFLIATTVPDMLSMILIFGTINSAFIPVLSRTLTKEGEKRFADVLSSSLNLSLILFVSIALLASFFARDIITFSINYAGNGKTFSPEDIDLMVSLMRFIFFSQVILGISAIISSALQVYQRFLITQLAPLFYNLGALIGVGILVPVMHNSIWGYAFGLLLGSLLHLTIQLPVLRNIRIRYKNIIELGPELREIVKLSIPRIFGVGITQIGIAISRFISIAFATGSVTALYNGIGIINIPFSLFGHTFSTAAFPFLSKDFSKKNEERFQQTFFKTFQEILFFIVPSAILIVVLRIPIVRLFYGVGEGTAFKWIFTLMTSWVVLFLGIMLIFDSLRTFLVRVFYARHDTLRPVLVGFLGMSIGIVVMVLASNYFSHFQYFSLRQFTPEQFDISYFFHRGHNVPAVGGVALGLSIASMIEVALLLLLIQLRILKLTWKDFWFPSLKKLIAGLITMVIVYMVFDRWNEIVDTAKTINIFVMTSLSLLMGASLYISLTSIFNDKEVLILYRFIEKQVKKRKNLSIPRSR